ncbi:MAG: HEAT repeat domain-containing protein [Planctomycetota bacterium]
MTIRRAGAILFRAATAVVGCLGFMASGCKTVSPGVGSESLRKEAYWTLKSALAYKVNPVVRAEAVEGLEAHDSPEGRAWIRTALQDEHPGVRFAACVAVGMLRDERAIHEVEKLAEDGNASVQVGALFALHQLDRKGNTGKLPTFVLTHSDPVVRRNAALVMGRMGESSAVVILAKAMKDLDEGVRHHALEAMAKLGNREAQQELAFMTSSGVGSEEVFAINALAALRDPQYIDTFRYKLETAIHLETQLAAARGLGMLGIEDGLPIARKALQIKNPPRDDPKDPPEEQLFRIRLLAIGALGAMGNSQALSAVSAEWKNGTDPRIQVAAAAAILDMHDRPKHDATQGHLKLPGTNSQRTAPR